MDTLRYALRSLARAPGFTAAAVLVLAIGIGANATMFGVVDTLLLRPPPLVREPASVVRSYVRQTFPGMGEFTGSTVSYPDYVDARDGMADFAGVAAFSEARLTSGRGAEARELRAVFATHSFFPLLGVRPALGRFFAADEDDPARPARVVVLDHGLWQRQFAGDPAVLGRTLPLGDALYTVVGVAPRGFGGVNLEPVDIWLPLAAADPLAVSADAFSTRNWQWIEVVARLRPGATVAGAQAAATTLRRNAYADARNADPRAEVILGPIVRDRGPDRSRGATVALWLGGVAVVVLLVACANVANLMLTRSLRRRREIAVRLALGISRGRLVRLLATESLLIALAGGVAGLAIALLGGRVIARALLADVGDVAIGMDPRVLAFTAAVTLLTALLSGLVPALQASRPDLTSALRSGARAGVQAHRRLRDGLVVAQIALTILLLVGAGLFVRSLRHAVALDMGMDAGRLVVASMDLREAGYSRLEADALYRRMLERLQALPEAEQAALAVSTPFSNRFSQGVRIPGRDSLPRPASGGPYFNGVTGSFLATTGTAVRRGRGITDADVSGDAPVVVINEALARLYWPGQDPLGQCLYAGRTSTVCRTVVGVVEDARMGELREAPAPQLYLPLAAGDTLLAPMRALFVRARSDDPAATAALVGVVRHAMQQTGADLPYASVRRLPELYARQVRPWRLGATMFSIFGGAALVLAVVGLYAVLAYGVSQRTHEIGVRLALGADGGTVVRLVVSQGVRVAALGLVIGTLGALAGARLLREQLFGVAPNDPATFVTVALALLGVAVLASWLPARRASRVNPAEALRTE